MGRGRGWEGRKLLGNLAIKLSTLFVRGGGEEEHDGSLKNFTVRIRWRWLMMSFLAS